MFEVSLEEETSSYGSLDALIINVGREINHVEVPMPLLPCWKRRYKSICKGWGLPKISFRLAYGPWVDILATLRC